MTFRSIGAGIAGAALLITSIAAQAADIPIKSPRFSQPAVAAFSWTGFYVGATVGYASGTSQHVVPTSLGGPLAGVTASDPFKVTGGLFGVTLGYNYQISNWVLGIESDWSMSSKSGVHGSSISLLNPLFTVSTSEEWIATVRARLGYAWDRWLVYGTAGWAVARVKAEDLGLLTGASETQTVGGWAGGAGVEWAFAQNWSAKFEYLYIGLDTKTFFNPNPNPLGVPHAVSLNNNIYRIGFNYRF
jgi:outer membrane immunogenic protein